MKSKLLASSPYTWMISNVVRYHPVKESIHSQSCGKYYLPQSRKKEPQIPRQSTSQGHGEFRI